MNLIMSDITYRCQSNNIAFSPLVDGKALNLIDKNDLYIGMSNLFDNAISYVKELPKDKRYINFIVKKVNNFIIIKETNYLMNPNLIEFNKDGSIKSTKKAINSMDLALNPLFYLLRNIKVMLILKSKTMNS